MTGVLIAAVIIAVPLAAFVMWPLLRRQGAILLPLPPDPREQLQERKRAALRALRELDFEHESGHISDEDHADLRARYEAEAAAVITSLDALAPVPVPVRAAPAVPAAATTSRAGWKHPLALGACAIALLVFGVGIGVGIVRYTEPDPGAGGGPMPGPGPIASADAPGTPAGGGGGGPIPPEVMRQMLDAARQSLFAERYSDAIAAYQAVLKRDPKNVDAMTHLGLIVAIGGHADSALQTFDKVLAMNPNYPPALLYRGQILYDSKGDTAGAIKSWEKFLAVSPPGQERERVVGLIAAAKSGAAPKR